MAPCMRVTLILHASCTSAHATFASREFWLKMFSRNSQPSSSSAAPPWQAFQEDVEDLYAENLVSAQRISKVLDKATKAGISQINPKVRRTIGKNQARDVTRFKIKWSKWPDYYWFSCRLLDRKTQKEYTTDIPVNLPLEILEVLWDLGDAEVLLSEANLDTAGKHHMKRMREQLGVTQLLGWGMHGDGVPCNYDRTESVIMISLNLPGLSGRYGRMRIPLCICQTGQCQRIHSTTSWRSLHGACAICSLAAGLVAGMTVLLLIPPQTTKGPRRPVPCPSALAWFR